MAVRRLRWGAIYTLCAGAVVGALAFVTATALQLEAQTVLADQRTKVRDTQQELLRTALWRLDSYLLPLLSREGSRPYFEYLAYYPQERAYTRYLSAIEKGDVLVPSPLLLAAPAPFRLFFQIDDQGQFTSPQAPIGNQRDLAEATCSVVNPMEPTPTSPISSSAPVGVDDLRHVQQVIVPEEVRRSIAAAEQLEGCALAGCAPESLNANASVEQRTQGERLARQQQLLNTKLAAKNDAEWSNRALAPFDQTPPPARVTVGSLVPLWLGTAELDLYFFRHVSVGEQRLLQGIWCPWPQLRTLLLDSIAGLLPGADLVPLRELGASYAPGETSSLTTIPVRLVVPEPAVPPAFAAAPGLSAAQVTMLVAWGAVIAALVGGWWLVRSSVALGERRNRFASAVTHELRTPLTTFRMYSEMLADGMVREPEQRQLYLTTLKEQSGRLAMLVENVLAYARLEEGRGQSRRERVAASALLERHRELLARRAADGAMELVVTGAASVSGAWLTTDGDAVGQVLFNLVDNACKYAHSATDPRIELTLHRTGAALELCVRDHGAGISEALRRQIFAPFERGARNGDPTPGVGLGLALARGVARDLGGELTLDGGAPGGGGGGACFRLRLPLDG